MITEDYVSYETAKLLKEKGFDENCFRSYVKDKLTVSQGFNNSYYTTMYSDARYRPMSAPTIQMVMKWLREEHDLHIDIFVTYKDGIPHYQWSVDNLKTQDTISETPCCNTYEEAVEATIKYCLKNLI